MISEGFKDLKVYKLSFDLAMNIFQLSKEFPKEEKYALTDQIRRASRSVCANIAEAYRKRIYPKHFVSKLTDADGECSETLVWLEFSLHCEYLSKEKYDYLISQYSEVGKMLGSMMLHPEKFAPK